MQRGGLGCGDAEVGGGAFGFAEGTRVETGEVAENHQRLKVVAVAAGVIVVVGPEAELAEGDAVVGIRVGHAGFEGAVPRFADREHGADQRGAGGGEVAAAADVERHGFDGLSVPGAFFRIRLIGAGPRGDQANVDPRILAAEQLGNLLGGADEFRGVARLEVVEHALAEHHDAVPRAADQVGFFLDVQIESGAADGFEAHGEIEAGLVGEDFEQGRHTALALAVEIGDGVGAVVARGRARAKHEAVADEENRFGTRRGRRRGHAADRGDRGAGWRFRPQRGRGGEQESDAGEAQAAAAGQVHGGAQEEHWSSEKRRHAVSTAATRGRQGNSHWACHASPARTKIRRSWWRKGRWCQNSIFSGTTR